MYKKNRYLLLIVAFLALLLASFIYFDNVNQNKKQSDLVAQKPTPTPKPAEKITTADILTFGDLLYHSTFLLDQSEEAFSLNFKNVTPYFEAADLVIGNYETTTNPNYDYSGYPQFNTPAVAATSIKKAGIDVLNTNNNHSMDTRLQGVETTLETLRNAGIRTVGTNLEGESKRTDLTVNEINIGLLSYSYGYNGFETILDEHELTQILSIINEENMKQEIEASKVHNDVTMVIMHWGNEYQLYPSDYQRELAHKLAEWGVDVVIGTHPHVVQTVEQIDNTFVIYSLGNFLSDQRLESVDDINTEQGLMVGFTITKDHNKNLITIDNKTYIPTWVSKYRIDGFPYYEVIPTTDYINGTLDLSEYSQDSLNRIQQAYDTITERIQNGVE